MSQIIKVAQKNDIIVCKLAENIFEIQQTIDPANTLGETNATMKMSDMSPEDFDSIYLDSPVDGDPSVLVNALNAVKATADKLIAALPTE